MDERKYPTFNSRKRKKMVSHILYLAHHYNYLILTYPNEDYDKNKKFKKFDLLYGDKGLKQTMNYKKCSLVINLIL